MAVIPTQQMTAVIIRISQSKMYATQYKKVISNKKFLLDWTPKMDKCTIAELM